MKLHHSGPWRSRIHPIENNDADLSIEIFSLYHFLLYYFFS